MAWHGRHGRKRRVGRILKKAMKAFLAAGGASTEITDLKIEVDAESIGCGSLFNSETPDTIGSDLGDITSELLTDALRLTHPDVHPHERRELATRVTRELNALAPYVFPAPKPNPVPTPDPTAFTPRARPATLVQDTEPAAPPYPCAVCKNDVPYYYCRPCRAEYERRQEATLEKERQKQRAWYRARKARALARRRALGQLPRCAACHKPFEPKRKDSKYCRPACRQAAHRHRHHLVTDKNSVRRAT
jgi:hypothetical protein